MDDDVKFLINNKVDIIWDDGDYKSNIEDVTEKYLAISIPIKEGQYIPLRVGEKLEVIYYAGKELYKFYTIVIGRKVDRIPIILLEIPQELVHVQRRRFVRIPVILNFEYKKFNSSVEVEYKRYINNQVWTISKVTNKGIMLDISGGGMRVAIKENLLKNEYLLVRLSIDTDEFFFKSKVTRIEKNKDGQNFYGLSFEDVDERVRDRIIRYTFKLMREQRKKALEED